MYCEKDTRLIIEELSDNVNINQVLFWEPGDTITIKFLNEPDVTFVEGKINFPIINITCEEEYDKTVVLGPADTIQDSIEKEAKNILQGHGIVVSELVKTIIQTRFTPYLGLNIVFVDSDQDANVRISFNSYNITSTRIGISCLEVKNQKLHTTTFGWIDVGTVLHVFCNILGMCNDLLGVEGEEPVIDLETEFKIADSIVSEKKKNPAGASSLHRKGGFSLYPIIDKEKVYELFVKDDYFNREWVSKNILIPPIMYHSRNKAIGGYREYQDIDTIMSYYIPQGLRKIYEMDQNAYKKLHVDPGFKTREQTHMRLNRRLSEGDYYFLQSIYPMQAVNEVNEVNEDNEDNEDNEVDESEEIKVKVDIKDNNYYNNIVEKFQNLKESMPFYMFATLVVVVSLILAYLIYRMYNFLSTF